MRSPRHASLRLPSLLLSVLVLLLGCGGDLAAPASAGEQTAQGDGIFLEEQSPTFFVELSRTTLFGMTEVYALVRFVPWRQITKEGKSGSVRMSLGYGSGLDRKFRREMGDNPFAQFMSAMADQWEERLYFQLTGPQIQDVLAFLDRVEKIELLATAKNITRRFVEAKWGDLRISRNDNGYFLFVAGDPGGWEPLPLDRLRAALKKAAADLAALMEAPASARW